jgi:mRNA interferase MazF
MKKGDIWLVELPSANGREQAGNRPVIVLSETQVNVTLVIPFTSNVQALRFPYTLEVKASPGNGLSTLSIALVFQARAIDKKRMKKKIGHLEDSNLHKMNTLLKRLLDL